MAIPERICPQCEFSFVPRRRSQTYCCVECRNVAVSRASAERRGDAMRGSRKTGGGRYIKRGGLPEHRVVAEAALGRPLRPGEVVHHLNDDERDNRASNLITMPSQSAHMKLGHRGGQGNLKRGAQR